MNYELKYLDDQGVLRFRSFVALNGEDVRQLMPALVEMSKDKERKLLFVDLTQNPTGGMLDKGARQAAKEFPNIAKFDKIAVIGVTPVARMFVKIGLSLIHQTGRIFKTEKEAIAWLKE